MFKTAAVSCPVPCILPTLVSERLALLTDPGQKTSRGLKGSQTSLSKDSLVLQALHPKCPGAMWMLGVRVERLALPQPSFRLLRVDLLETVELCRLRGEGTRRLDGGVCETSLLGKRDCSFGHEVRNLVASVIWVHAQEPEVHRGTTPRQIGQLLRGLLVHVPQELHPRRQSLGIITVLFVKPFRHHQQIAHDEGTRHTVLLLVEAHDA